MLTTSDESGSVWLKGAATRPLIWAERRICDGPGAGGHRRSLLPRFNSRTALPIFLMRVFVCTGRRPWRRRRRGSPNPAAPPGTTTGASLRAGVPAPSTSSSPSDDHDRSTLALVAQLSLRLGGVPHGHDSRRNDHRLARVHRHRLDPGWQSLRRHRRLPDTARARRGHVDPTSSRVSSCTRQAPSSSRARWWPRAPPTPTSSSTKPRRDNASAA